MIIFNSQHTNWKKASFLMFLVLFLGCFCMPSCILSDYPPDDCYERNWEYPEECWETYYGEECCEWRVSRQCVEVWCSELDNRGYNECRWGFEERYCY